MTTSFAILGCCASRDVFFSQINPNYKSYFQLKNAAVRNSLISIMSQPVDYIENSIKILPEDKTNNYRTRLIKEDFEKSFLNQIKYNACDYLLFDSYFDAKWGVIDLGDKYITNNLWDLPDTIFYKDLKEINVLNVHNNFKEFFSLWKESCDKFFDFLNEYCPDLRVVIHPIKNIYRMLEEDGSITINNEFKLAASRENQYLDLFNAYICKNYDVEILKFDNNILASKNHPWGENSVHFESKYYSDLTNQLNDIIKRNELLGFNSNISKEFRDLKRNHFLSNGCSIINSTIESKETPFDKILLEYENKRLSNQVKELTKFKEDVLNSNSWKLTSPLRKVRK